MVLLDVEMTIQIVKTFEANYPEYVHRIFVINGKSIRNCFVETND